MTGQFANGAIVSHYRLDELVGAGGMGEVYRATDMQTGRVVAVKIFGPAAVEARDLARFYHEAKIHRSLDHPNIVRVHELIDVHGRPGLVMEYVDGESLAARIARLGRLPPGEALEHLRDLAGALAYVHARDIVHRDVKPANVRLTSSGVLKLLDFGIAKSAYVHGLTKTGNVIGTPRYLSPEQLLGEPVTPASDVWALGVLLYEMVSGQVPFEGATVSELWKRIDSGRYAQPSQLVGASTSDEAATLAGIDAIAAACLEREPGKRLASAQAVVERANAVLGGGAARAMPTVAPTGRDPIGTPRSRTSLSGSIEAVSRSWRWLLIAAVAVWLIVWIGLWMMRDDRDVAPGERAVEHIESTADPADVFVNGRRVGQTPMDYTGRTGVMITIELRKDGYQPAHGDVQLTVHGSTTLSLEPIGKQP